MSDFKDNVKRIIAKGREQADKQKRGTAEEHKAEVAAERAREEAISKAHGIAMRLSEGVIRPRIDEIRGEIGGGGLLHVHIEKELGFAGCSLEYGEAECLALKLHFDEHSFWLSAEARCERVGTVYEEQSDTFDSTQSDEAVVQTWIESHSCKALKAFAEHAEAIRNPPPTVRYGQRSDE